MSETPSGPVESCPQEQSPADIVELQNASSGGPRPLLPGELYQRQNQWWWRVQLPGEDKPAARPLPPDGEATPSEGRGDACVARAAVEPSALALWEHAIQENAARRIRLESTEKIERLKAQFLDKVRHFTELVETANAKLELEQRARTEAEAKLAQMVQAKGPTIQDMGQPGQDERPSAMQSPTPALPEPGMEPIVAGMPAPKPAEPIISAPIPVAAQPAPGVVATPVAAPLPPLETGTCECCGATGVAMTHLTRIDSGQSLCPRCLAALRAEAARSA